MNERIQELAKQAGIKLAKGDNEDQKFYWFSHLSQLEGFAELIVKECIDTVLDCTVEYTTRPQVANEIKQHFGVEE